MYIGLCGPQDLIDIRRLYEAAFDDTAEFIDYYFENKVCLENITIIKEDQELVAMMHMNPFVVQFNRHHYNVSYIVAVATAQTFRNRGYMGRLMAYSLRKLYDDGEVFSLLMPIDSRIYERYGFGFTEDHLYFDCITDTFTSEKYIPECQVATYQDMETLANIYSDFSKKMDLTTYRDVIEFQRLYKELMADGAQIILFENGYIMTYYDHNVLNVREFVANSEAALKEIMSYLRDISHGGRINIHDHMRSRIKHFLPNIPDNRVTLKPFMMARVINIQKFIEMNGALFEDITIKVVDEYIKENNQCFQISKATVCIVEEDNYDVVMDVKTFTQLAFGYLQEDELEGLSRHNHFLNRKGIMKPSRQKTHFFNEYV